MNEIENESFDVNEKPWLAERYATALSIALQTLSSLFGIVFFE